MDHQPFNLEELAIRLGRDRREVEKLVQRGTIPGRKVGGQWQFNPVEVHQWLEQDLRTYNPDQLTVVEEAQQSPEADRFVPVSSLLAPETVEVPLEARTKRSVLESLVEVAGRTWQVWEPATVLKAVLAREEILSTGFENGVAIPHPRTPLPDVLGASVVAFGRTFAGVPFGAPGRQLTEMFFLVLCRDPRTHLLVLARLGRMLQLPDFLDNLRAANDSRTAYDVICAADEQLKPGGTG